MPKKGRRQLSLFNYLRPLCSPILTADDGLTRENNAFAAALRNAGDTHVTTRHFATDHAYSDKRIELSHVVLAWLKGLPK